MSAPPWTNAWNEASPADSDLANTLGTTGRQLRLDIRQRLDWQHVWNVNTSDDGGHRFVAIASAYHPANTSSFAAAGYSLTGANAQSVIDLAGTWNTSGVPTGIKLNILNSASGAGALLMDLQVGGVSKFSVDVNGTVTALGLTRQSSSITTTSSLVLNASYADLTNVTVSITPFTTTKRFRITAAISLLAGAGNGGATTIDLQLLRNGSVIATYLAAVVHVDNNTTSSNHIGYGVIDIIDQPASTSPQAYKVQGRATIGTLGSATFNANSATSSLVVQEV